MSAPFGLGSISRFVRARSWIATVAASFITFYALDIVATGAGLLLAASGLLGGISHWQALALWVATNAVWGVGLWSMMLANWDLLQRTGASTNILSKAAHDLVARATASRRWRCAAAHVGYLSTELAKEAPYYLGAAGAALFSDSISAIDALVFLVGANLGAAAYGFTLAHGVRLFARRAGERQPEMEGRPAEMEGASPAETTGDDRSSMSTTLPPLMPRR
jgi:hypothetical protein